GADPVKLVCEIIERDGYDHVAVGAPTETNSRVRATVLTFATRLEKMSGVQVSLVDEHLTSKMADIIAKDHGGREHDDALAATLIVEAFLNNVNNLNA
ncbi:MAG: Holliday junction resolvase RuvX, partial [Patescibacteria group bacterium]